MNQLPSMIAENQIATAAEQVMRRCEILAGSSACNENLTRTFCCPQMHEVHREVASWMVSAGLAPHIDAAGNIIGQQTQDTERGVFLVGSHLDTVADAGKYDGSLGVLLGIACAELVQDSNLKLAFALDVVGFSEEEGVRFNTPYIGSSAVAGCLDPSILNIVDNDGISVRAAIQDFGLDPDNIPSSSYVNRNLVGYLEAHIEQGPLLESQGCPVGVVSAIAGQTRATINFSGKAGHAGTVPHDLRHDALAAAAEFVGAVERIGRETAGLFATVGELNVSPNVSNVIPGHVSMRLDLRHETNQVREDAFAKLQTAVETISGQRGIANSIEANLSQPAVQMDEQIQKALSKSIRKFEMCPTIIPSGAGHDSAMMAKLAPAGMLFVRCRDGISHHPDEFVSEDDVTVALKIMFNTLIEISSEVESKRFQRR